MYRSREGVATNNLISLNCLPKHPLAADEIRRMAEESTLASATKTTRILRSAGSRLLNLSRRRARFWRSRTPLQLPAKTKQHAA